MATYIIFGGCIVLAIFWMLASLPVMRMGSTAASLVFDGVTTLVVIALFAAGTCAYRGQLNQKAAQAAAESESGQTAEGESAGETAAGTDAQESSPQGVTETEAVTDSPQQSSSQEGSTSAAVSGSVVPAESGEPSSAPSVPAEPETAARPSGAVPQETSPSASQEETPIEISIPSPPEPGG